LAGAYGGVAKPKPKRQGVKYTTDINAGLRDIATPNNMRKEYSRRGFAQGSMSGGHGMEGPDSSRKRHIGGAMAGSDAGSNFGGSVSRHNIGSASGSKLLDPQQREAKLKQQQMDDIKRRQIAKAAAKRKAA